MPHHTMPRLHLESLARPFTPVSPLNLEPLTTRYQQVYLTDLNYYSDSHSGLNTPLASSVNRGLTPDHYFDEEDDKRSEVRADAQHPFPVDRVILKDIIENKMGTPVAFIQFLSSGTFHKAFLVHLRDKRELIARIARRFMPTLKIESEVATINYLRAHTNIPVPTVYFYDSNPYNKLGNEYILMSKASGVPLSYVYNRLTDDELRDFLRNLANLIVPLLSHRFTQIGSLYQRSPSSLDLPPTPPASESGLCSPSSSPIPNVASLSDPPKSDFLVGPIVSWPFFGDGRGELDSFELDRGPWSSETEYLQACANREIDTVRREAAGTEKGHRPHLPPTSRLRPASSVLSRSNTVVASLRGYLPQREQAPLDLDPDSDSDSIESDTSSDASSVEETFYRDYRANLRSSLLVAQHATRVQSVIRDMERFIRYMTHDLGVDDRDPDFAGFAFHMHDLSLTNIFVDPENRSKITCIIDWESTTIRPIWHCAHLPAFLQPAAHNSHVREAAIFRAEVAKLGAVGELWLRADQEREAWRSAHRFLEWDGWEEGLLTSVIGDKGALANDADYVEELGGSRTPHALSARLAVGRTSFKAYNGFVGLKLT